MLAHVAQTKVPLKYKFKPPRLGTAFIEVGLGKGFPPFSRLETPTCHPRTNRKKTRSIAAHDPTPKNQLQVALMNFLPSSSSSRLSCFWAQGASVCLPSALAGTPRKHFLGLPVGFLSVVAKARPKGISQLPPSSPPAIAKRLTPPFLPPFSPSPHHRT